MAEAIDLPAFAAAFGRAVHAAGIPVAPERSARFARALALAPPARRDRLYWTARAVFVSSREQVDAFDRVFGRVVDGLADPAEGRGDPNAPPPPGTRAGPRAAPPHAAPLDAAGEGGAPSPSGLREPRPDGEEAARERALPVAAASALERLATRDFGQLSPEELRALRRLMRELSLAPPPRLARRSRRDRRGRRVDLRATLRAGRRTGGDPARLVLRRRLERPRRLVVLCDVSGSMEPYSRAFLQFLHAAVGGADAEAFVFATRLTRLTRALRGGQPDLAIERASAAVRDWSGGTRIGASLRRFVDDHGRRGMARGAVVVIVSDGWERGDPALVGEQMARLRRLAHRVVWVNPRKAARGFQPATGGMAAALPWCDAFVAGHDLNALSAVAEAIATPRSGR
ncbi:vWA domain-containing protein [Conexibacter arvalis]|uniref:VWFA domain-containing protein n=1 Tax=Conexibacter arvalis TaxID=912552 RepID=A0A840IDD9_9ACTN|nr:VWA domain-containing protein [Conexibacter arvalis]MBB4662084.1 hypothetical protein [Conexibacter arvalis]